MLTPTHDYRRTDYRVPRQPFTGLDAVANGIAGRYQRRVSVRESLERDAQAIDAQARDWSELTDAVLQRRLLEFREKFRLGGRWSDNPSCLRWPPSAKRPTAGPACG